MQHNAAFSLTRLYGPAVAVKGSLRRASPALDRAHRTLLSSPNPLEFQKRQPDGFPITSFNVSKYPIFDVYVSIRSHVDSSDPKYILQEPTQTELGTIPSGVKETNLRLPFGYYQIDICTLYEKYTEMLKFMPFNGQIGVSYRVTDFHDGHVIVQETYPKGFPGV